MSWEKSINKNKISRLIMRRYRLPLLMLVLLFMMSGTAHSQLIIDSVNYAIDIGDASANAGDTVAIPIQTKNQIVLGGFLIRFTYPSAYLRPLPSDGCPNDACPGYCCDSTGIDPLALTYDSVLEVGRGLGTVQVDTAAVECDDADEYPIVHNIRALHYPGDDSMHVDVVFLQFLPPIPPFDQCALDYWHQPTIPANTGDANAIANVYFIVNPNPPGSGAFLRVRDYRPEFGDDPDPDYRDNQFTDETGTIVIRPIGAFGTGQFTIGDPGTGEPDWDTCSYGICQDQFGADTCCAPSSNAQPVVSIANTSYTVDQGQTVSFTVNATDADGDQLSLLATQLPTGATFSPSNPVAGTGSVSGTFTWTPSFSQSGGFSIVFRATDANNAIGQRTVSISVNELNIDRLFTTSSYGASPVGGIPGSTPIVFPIDLITSRTVYGIQFDMIYPYSIVEIDSIVVTDLTPEYVVYENIGQYPDSIRVAAFGLSNEPILDPVTSTAILNTYMTLDADATPNDYWVYLRNAWESVDPNPSEPSLGLIADSGVVQVDMFGDVNLDKMVNVADMVNVVGSIIGSFVLEKRNFETADVVRDSVVNVVDLIGIINMVFGRPVQKGVPAKNATTYESVAKLDISHDDLFAGQLTKINVKGEFPDDVAGVQLQIDYDPNAVEFDQPELAAAAGRLILAYNDDKAGRLKILLYTQKPWELEQLIPSGVSDVINLPASIKQNIDADDNGRIRITQAYLSSKDAVEIPLDQPNPILPATFNLYQNYPNPFNPVTSIDFDISHSASGGVSDVRLDIFNILGQNVKTLVDEPMGPGTYTVEWDGTNAGGSKVATGIYLYRLQVGDKHQSKKMLLLK